MKGVGGVKQSLISWWLHSSYYQQMQIEESRPQLQQEPVMILMEGLDETEDDPDLLDLLTSEPTFLKKGSLNYDYHPSPPDEIIDESSDLKTSNRSASTCPDNQPPVRRCTCLKTRCLKNYCQCFKLGEVCGPECECKDCGNRQRLFIKPAAIKIKCKCLKSHCLKKYCECHSMGVKCGPECKCFECENGLEHGMTMMDVEMEGEEPSVNYFDHHLFFDI